MKNEKDPLLDELAERIAEGPIVFTPDEEFLYFFGPQGWKAFSVEPVYLNDEFIKNDIHSLEIPEDDEVAVA